ncbi:alpha/beta hydrolase [Leptospira sp. WS92.C1]
MKKIISIVRTFFYLLSEILEFFVSLISSLIPSGVDPNLSRGDIYVVTGFLSGPFFYSKLCKALQLKGYQPRILKIPPFFLNTKNAIEKLANQMDLIPPKSVLIAHNTGGLLTLLLPDRSRQKIRGLVTLGTPFRGSHLFSVLPVSGLRYGSSYLQEFFKTFLFMDRFHPLAPFKEFVFFPASSSIYGEERDLWFDIPGNYNQVRKGENIRTILEFLVFHYPSAAVRESKKAVSILSESGKKQKSKGSSRKTGFTKKSNSQKPIVKSKKKIISKPTPKNSKIVSKKSVAKKKKTRR